MNGFKLVISVTILNLREQCIIKFLSNIILAFSVHTHTRHSEREKRKNFIERKALHESGLRKVVDGK